MRTVKERLEYFIKMQGITNKKFEQMCGLSNGYVHNLGKSIGNGELEGNSTLDRITAVFPDLDAKWLLYGSTIEIGDNSVVANNINGDNMQNGGKVMDALAATLTEKDKQIAKAQEQIDRLLTIIEKMQG